MSDDTIKSFGEALANKHNDAKLWSPLECLKALVRDLENGVTAPVDLVFVAMARKAPNGEAKAYPFYMAGGTALEMRGLLVQHTDGLCDRFG